MDFDRWKRIEAIYHLAVEASVPERGRLLDRECGNDTELRVEVETLLAFGSGTNFLQQPAFGHGDRELSPTEPSVKEGQQLGNYTVLSLLGKGGMGEVYRARDSKLGRDVALKVLPVSFALDPDRAARFDREARLLAALNHPNIATIYGVEEHGDQKLLVLEVIEGETLAERLKRGPIAEQDVMKLGLQIAQALEAAHEKGVIHRDLKPANIKITPEGRAKVLDFGLAKSLSGSEGDIHPADTLTATQGGVVLGTAAYLSPEQVRGENVDKRADVWGFGCVMFEMLTGRGAFSGKTLSDLLASVLKTDPNWSSLPGNVHPRLRYLLQDCLEKSAALRCQSIAEARATLEKILASPDASIPAVQPTRSRSHSTALWAIILLFAIGLTGLVAWNLRLESTTNLVRFEHLLPDGISFRNLQRAAPALAISPDGKYFLYNATGGFYVRPLGESAAHLIPGTEGNFRTPTVSPAGDWIAFWNTDTDQLMKIQVTGGQPTKVADLNGYPFGISWSEGGILYGQPDGIWLVSENGGEPKRLIDAHEGEQLSGPFALPGREWILFASTTSFGDNRWNEASLMAQSLSGERRVLLEGGSDPQYLPTGHLIYSYKDKLLASKLNLDTMKVDENRVEVVQGIDRTGGLAFYSGRAAYAISNDGTLIWSPQAISSDINELLLVRDDRKGNLVPVIEMKQAYQHPRESPDGKSIAVEITETKGTETTTQIWIVDPKMGKRQLTFEGTLNRFPTWTPDGKSIVFASNRQGTFDLYRKAADGGGGAEVVLRRAKQLWPSSISRDNVLAFVEAAETGGQLDIRTLDLDGSTTDSAFLATEESETAPWFSPDGRAIAYSTRNSVCIRPYPRRDETLLCIPVNGAGGPVFFPDGELVFVQLQPARMMAVGIQTYPTLRLLDQPKPAGYTSNAASRNPGLTPWGPSSDKTMLFTTYPTQSGSAKINVELNWFDELKKKVPAP